MAGEPKRRHSKARKRTRRAAIKLAVNLVNCKNCSKLTLSHIVCKECGFYGNKAVTKDPLRRLPLKARFAKGDSEARKVKVTKA